MSNLRSLIFTPTPSITIALPSSSIAVLPGQFSDPSQRVLPARELIRMTFGQLSSYFTERSPGPHLAENVLIHQAVRIEFRNVCVALFAQATQRKGLAVKSGLVEMRFDLSGLCGRADLRFPPVNVIVPDQPGFEPHVDLIAFFQFDSARPREKASAVNLRGIFGARRV